MNNVISTKRAHIGQTKIIYASKQSVNIDPFNVVYKKWDSMGNKRLFVYESDNDRDTHQRRVILLLITKLMTWYASADKQYGRMTHTYTLPALQTCKGIMAKSVFVLSVADYQLDSEITGQQRHTHKHTYTHTHTVAPATDREPHQTSFNEVTSPKYK